MSNKPSETTATAPASQDAAIAHGGMPFLAGIVTGITCALLWATAAVIVWTIPEKAPAVAAIAGTVTITVTVIINIINRIDLNR